MAFPNLIKALGGIDRENPEWSGSLGKMAGEKGISIRRSPSWVSGGKPFTLGNTMFIPEQMNEEIQEHLSADYYGNIDTQQGRDDWAIEEEFPHIQQYREKGLLGFLGKYVWDLAQHGMEGSYEASDALEGVHWSNPAERSRLVGGIFND